MSAVGEYHNNDSEQNGITESENTETEFLIATVDDILQGDQHDEYEFSESLSATLECSSDLMGSAEVSTPSQNQSQHDPQLPDINFDLNFDDFPQSLYLV